MKDKEVKCAKCGKSIKTSDEGVVGFKMQRKTTWFCKECGEKWLDFLRKIDMIVE